MVLSLDSTYKESKPDDSQYTLFLNEACLDSTYKESKLFYRSREQQSHP